MADAIDPQVQAAVISGGLGALFGGGGIWQFINKRRAQQSADHQNCQLAVTKIVYCIEMFFDALEAARGDPSRMASAIVTARTTLKEARQYVDKSSHSEGES